MNECLISSTTHSDSQSIIIPDLLSIENRVRVRRRSSLDQQIIERWKVLVEQCKKHEQLPWTIRKLMIRRHFRRHYKAMSRQSEQINTSIHVTNRQMNMKNYPFVIQLDSDDCQ
jgi:hypothetical protein